MEKFYAFTSDWQLLQMANKCHLYLPALFISDISDGSGRYILDDAWTGAQHLNEHRHSSWPNQGKPSKVEWSGGPCFKTHFWHVADA
jgi:hypothetical protein